MFHTKIIQMKQRGVSIYLSLMVIAVLLAIGLGISTIVLTQLKMFKEVGDSVIAIHAADTGIERILYQDKYCREPLCVTSSPPTFCTLDCTGLENDYFTTGDLENQATYQAEYLNVPQITIKSVGIYKETRRAIEVTR